MGAVSIPPIGAKVWIEFEGGNRDYPIWTGCWYGSAAEVPALALATQPPIQGFTFATSLQNSITISDVPGPTGGILLKAKTGATIMVNDLGITIQNGQGASITLTGPTVSINNGALSVI